MNKRSLSLTKFLNGIYFFSGYISGTGIIIIAVIMFYDVLMRYIFGLPTYWADEVSEYIIIWAVFISMAWVLKMGKHIRVELIFDRLPDFWKQVANLICILFSLFFFVIFIYASIKMSLQSVKLWRTSISPLHMPMVIPHMSLVVGGILVFLQLLSNFSNVIDSLTSGKSESKEDE